MKRQTDVRLQLARALSGGPEWADSIEDTWPSVMDAAVEHGVDALLWQALAGTAGRGEQLRRRLDPLARASVTRELFLGLDLVKVAAGLASAGVPALITKGTALAYTVYPQPWLRPRVDTDLLVAQSNVAGATQVLTGCGYAKSDAISTGELVSHQVAFERTDGHGVRHVIDLHWKIANPQLLADALSFDDLWRAAQPVPALGPAARVPSTIGSLALACVHRLAHHQGQERLIWLYDMKLLATGLNEEDWAAFQEFVCEHGIAGLCLDGLRSARLYVGAPFPAEVERAFAAAAPGEPSRAYLEGPVTKRDVLFSDLKVLDTWSDRIRLIREHAFPPAAFIRQRYGTQSRWLLPALYVHRLITGAARWGRS